MSRDLLTLFCLYPYKNNGPAEYTISHRHNSRLVSMFSDGTLVLDIGFHIRSKPSSTLATLGRGDLADIYLPYESHESLADVQCSFEMNLDTGIVLFHDKSNAFNSQVFGPNATPFEPGRARKVVVSEHLNTRIRMGGKRGDLIQFELKWYQDPRQVIQIIKSDVLPCSRVVDWVRAASSIDLGPTERQSGPYTSGPMRYVTEGSILGSRRFGTVHKAIDADSGQVMAVKKMEPFGRAEGRENFRRMAVAYDSMRREVECLLKIQHVDKNLRRSLIRVLINICASHILSNTLPHKVGRKCNQKFLWG